MTRHVTALPPLLDERPGLARLGWLFAALAVAMAPQTLHQQPWITAFVLLLGAWRYLAEARGWRLPPPAFRLALALAAFALVWVTHRRVTGIESGSAFLLMLMGVKFTETARLRDCIFLVFMGFFLVMAEFLYSQEIPVVAWLLPAIWLLAAAFLNITHSAPRFSPLAAARYSGRLIFFALPFVIVMFVLFPRVPGPLWGVPASGGEAVSGLDDTMTPGNITRLALSREVAFRVTFEGAPPPPSERYWRGPTLHEFDGRTWSIGLWRYTGTGTFTPLGRPVTYTVTLEPHNRPWLFALELPAQRPPEALFQPDYLMLSKRPVRQRMRYEAVSYLRHDTRPGTPAVRLARDLRLPARGNSRARALAERWRDESTTAIEIVERVLALFREEPFVYTLQPPPLGRNPVDEFLFETRRGFCEHYASAFTFLMRAAGVPARVVTGYQGGEPNPLSDYFIVRQSDAHAWSEVWLEGRGWVRVDPTAAVAPERIEHGLAEALPPGEAVPGGFLGDSEWLLRLQLTWDAINAGWNEWFLGYGPELQRQFLEDLGMDSPDWQRMTTAMAISIALLLLALTAYLMWLNRPRPPDPVVRAYGTFCARLAKCGIVRAAWEGPLDFAARARQARPDLADAIDTITSLYVGIRYGRVRKPSDIEVLRQQVATFRPA
ncbi:MAG TPA: DUF3488 and transglutaminase-like domain-containing protein [Gammaproteobacteria bacterium]|nr:DUF3488 and transglutaminase-like domain-containing protein [Gammaproteobacteria bacterium]